MGGREAFRDATPHLWLRPYGKTPTVLLTERNAASKNSMKIVEKQGFLQKSEQKCEKSLTNFCEYFEFGAVRRCANLVDLAKC